MGQVIWIGASSKRLNVDIKTVYRRKAQKGPDSALTS